MQSYLQYRSIRGGIRRQVDEHPGLVIPCCKDGNRRHNLFDNTEGNAKTEGSPDIGLSPLQGYSLRQRADFDRHPPPGIELSDRDHSTVFLVGWDHEKDTMNPRNFPLATRISVTLLVSAIAFVVSAASSIETAVLHQNSAAYNVSEVVASLATGIFLLGFAAGSLVSGPLSEILGRNVVYIGSLSLFMLFTMASGLAPNIGTQLLFRFLAGVFGCPPLTCAGGTIADIWDPLEKTLAFPLYAILSFGGAILSPLIASYMGQGTLSWRWTNCIILIMAGLVLVLVVLFQPETYSRLLMNWKASHLRKSTGDLRYQSAMDLDRTTPLSRIVTACVRQLTLPIQEPIILLLSLYMTVLYIVLFTFFDGYSYIFSDIHGLSQGLTNIVWVAMYVGIVLAALLVPVHYRRMKRLESLSRDLPSPNNPDTAQNGDINVSLNRDDQQAKAQSATPEHRLWYAMIGAPAIPISLFWMAWTDHVSHQPFVILDREVLHVNRYT